MPVLGAGAATLGREIDETDSYRILDRAFELGIRVFDTAEAYGGGNARAYRSAALGLDDVRETTGLMHSSEILLGRWIRSRGVRRQITLKTKVSSDFTAAGVHTALARSLERLQTDFVDVYYLHSKPASVPLEEPLTALLEARQSGLVRHIGVSNFALPDLEDAFAIAPQLSFCQNVYNLALREAEDGVIPFCKRNGASFVAYSPLGACFLTGKYGAQGEAAPKGTRFDVIPGHRDIYFRESCFQALARLTEASRQSGIPRHLLALAWVMRNPDVSIVLIGATKVSHVEHAMEAMKIDLQEVSL